MQKTLNLVNATAGKRLAAWLIDRIVPALALGIALGITLPEVLESSGSAQEDALLTFWMALLGASVVSLAYSVWLWGWEATAGKTPGNLVMGIRTTSEEGLPAGWGAIFLRGVIIALSGLVPVVGPVLMMVSNVWDPHHQRQGWHDKVAHTLVVDVKAGRNPLTTGGLFGPSTFAPGGTLQPGQPGHPETTAEPVPAGSQWPAFNAAVADGPITAVPGRTAPQDSAPAAGQVTAAPVSTTPSAAPSAAPQSSPGASSARTAQETPTAPQDAPARSGTSSGFQDEQVVMVGGGGDDSDPDSEMGSTQLRSEVSGPRTVKLRFDDGQVHEVSGVVLIGRNPAGASGETVDELIPFADMGRSVSKTHLHLTVDSTGVWVTDRNSTNGSAVTPRGGERQRLEPGQPVQAAHGATVHFGDRHFTVTAG